MRSLFHALIALLSSAERPVVVKSFFPARPIRVSPLQHCNKGSLHSFRSSTRKAQSVNDEGSSTNDWSLEQDWALMDRGPKFTIGDTDDGKRTFWTQLWISTPELSCKSSPEYLMERYQLLAQNQSLPTVGSSPEILQEWYVGDNAQMSGQLDGRAVWFVAHVVGRIEGDAVSGEAQPGGYVEAIGNRVYELGNRKNNGINAISTTVAENEGEEKEEKNGLSLLNGSWVIGTTAAMAAFVASTVLSAAIGYGAGLSILSEPFSPPAGSLPPTNALVQTIKIVPKSTPTRNEPSISEKRAKMEARVLREDRVVRSISARMDKDRAQLQTLRKEEKETVDVVTTTSSVGNNEQSVSEKRANMEAKVFLEERVVKDISQRLETDQVDLRQLLKEERGSSMP